MNFQNISLIILCILAIVSCGKDDCSCDNLADLGTRNGCAAPESPDGFTPEELIATYTLENDLTTQSTDSGLVYRIIEQGGGDSPSVTSTTCVDYVGYYRNGCEFDSNSSIEFPLANVIEGWTEGMQLIGSCGSIQLFIIPELGYNNDTSRGIAPDEPLIFDINLLSFE